MEDHRAIKSVGDIDIIYNDTMPKEALDNVVDAVRLSQDLLNRIHNLTGGQARMLLRKLAGATNPKILDEYMKAVEAIDVQPKKVHVVIHMFQGTLNEVAVHTKEDEARKDYEERIIKAYGELVEEQHGDDEIMLDETELKP